MGRKADYDKIVSVCATCHDAFHRGRLGRTSEWWDEQARQTEQRWQAIEPMLGEVLHDAFEDWDAED